LRNFSAFCVLISRNDSFIDSADREYFAIAYAWISGSTPNTAKTSVDGSAGVAWTLWSAMLATFSSWVALSGERCPAPAGSFPGVEEFFSDGLGIIRRFVAVWDMSARMVRVALVDSQWPIRRAQKPSFVNLNGFRG
jgi:hypothetical protein